MPTQSINGGMIHYEESGSGDPLVLLHGFPLDSRMWEAQRADLSSRARVITPDLPGFGKSSPPAPFTIESMADDIHVFLQAIGALPCILGGLSMGGYVALNYVLKYPSDLRGLILVDTRSEAENEQGKQGRQKMIDLVRASGPKAVADQMQPKMLSRDTVEHRPAQVRILRQMMEACPAKTIEYALAAMRNRRDVSGDLSSIKVPTLILVGDADSITPPSMAEAMQQKISGSQRLIIQGAGHMSPLEQPAQVNRAIRNFLDVS